MAGYSTTSEPAIYAFGPYRLDMGQRLLLHDNRPVPLAPKAIALLCVLVENHGKLVERERLMQMVWPGAFVEDGNLTVTVFALRKALAAGLGATVIENIPRRGYRFVAPVSLVEPAAAAERLASVSSPTVAGSVPAPAAPSRRPRTVELGLAAATALGALLIAFPRPAPQVADVRQISHFGQADGLGTDGARVFAGKRQGGRVTLVQFGPQGGDASDFPLPFASIRLLDVSSVRKEALVAATDVPGEWPVWIVPLSGRAPRRLGTVQSPSARWSADGKRVAYGRG